MKVLQIGIGGMGDFWLNIVRRSSDVQFAGFVEVNDDIAHQQIAKYELDPAQIYTSLEEALRKVRPDGIINVTPPQFHRPINFLALESGIPVLCEKPLAMTRQEAQDQADKAAQTGVLLMVAQNYRYTAVAQTVKGVLQSGELGALTGVSVEFYKAPRRIGFRETMLQPLIVDMAIHHFDMLRFFTDSSPVSVFAQTWNPPWSWFQHHASASVLATLANGVRFSYTASWVSQGYETPWNAHWRFECERGVLRIEQDQVLMQKSKGFEDRANYQHVAYGDAMQIPLIPMTLQAQDFLLNEFVEAISTGRTPGTTAQDNMNTIHFVFDAVESAASGQVISRS